MRPTHRRADFRTPGFTPVNRRVWPQCCYTHFQMPEAVRDTLLKASTMIYLFRAMTAAEAVAQKREVELHLISLVNDVSGTDGGFVVLAQPGKPLGECARERDFPGLDAIVQRVCA